MIEPTRHMSVFSPDNFGDQRIDVIGAGATGSELTIKLAKLGIENIHVWDFDDVEAHNIANQAFGINDIGKPKVESLQTIVKTLTGTEVTTHYEAVTNQKLGRYVFLLTDTMASRKEIFVNSLRMKMGVNLVVETRMGVNEGRVYTFNPMSPSHISKWEETLSDDEEIDPSVCSETTVVGSTAAMTAGIAVWQFLNYMNRHEEREDGEVVEFENEIIFSLNPAFFFSRAF